MTIELSNLIGNDLLATDGSVGTTKDFLFDDRRWTVRYLEVNTGNWLFGNRVLLSPVNVAIEQVGSDGDISVGLTKAQIENAPGLETDQPVSRQYEVNHAKHFGYGYYWLGGGIWGASAIPSGVLEPVTTISEPDDELNTADDSHLRLASEVEGYRLYSSDGDELGTVGDYLLDLQSWTITHVILQTGSWLSGRNIPFPTWLINEINWVDQRASTTVTNAIVNDAPAVALPLDDASRQAIDAHFAKYRKKGAV